MRILSIYSSELNTSFISVLLYRYCLCISHQIAVETCRTMPDKASGYSKKGDKMNSIDPLGEIGKAGCFKKELKYSM